MTEDNADLERKLAEVERTVARAHEKVQGLDEVLGKTDEALLQAERFEEGLRAAAPKLRVMAIAGLGILLCVVVFVVARRRAAHGA